MRLLAFDTSNNAVCLCLMDGQKLCFEKKAAPEGTHRQEVASLLIPAIDSALAQASWAKSQIDLVAVGVGPGSFTGIRFAVVSARTICQALDLPLVGVSTLESLAYEQDRPCAVLLGAGPGHFFAQSFAGREEDDMPPCYIAGTEIGLLDLNGRLTLADEAAGLALSELGFASKPVPVWENIAIIQAQIALRRLSLKVNVESPGDLPDELKKGKLKEDFPYGKVEPLYLRGPSLTLKKANGNSDKATNAL